MHHTNVAELRNYNVLKDRFAVGTSDLIKNDKLKDYFRHGMNAPEMYKVPMKDKLETIQPQKMKVMGFAVGTKDLKSLDFSNYYRKI
jgi:hypothetical protein